MKRTSTRLLLIHNHATVPKCIWLSLTTTSYCIFYNHVVISRVRMQLDVWAAEIHFHSNNIINTVIIIVSTLSLSHSRSPPQSVPGSSRGVAGRLWRCLLARCPSWRDRGPDTGTPDARPSHRRCGSVGRWPSPGARYGEGKPPPVGNDQCVLVPPSRTGPWTNPVANAGSCARLWVLEESATSLHTCMQYFSEIVTALLIGPWGKLSQITCSARLSSATD